ncbi:hypothetical protein, partial [Ideonella azotifigens]|uniref:hypothetical protein n=1 Tax=Ideonella azotifigens TaxID=513160 RepID=UPI0031DFC151
MAMVSSLRMLARLSAKLVIGGLLQVANVQATEAPAASMVAAPTLSLAPRAVPGFEEPLIATSPLVAA